MGYFLFYPVLLRPESLGTELLPPLSYSPSPGGSGNNKEKKRGGGGGGGGGGNQLWFRVWEESLAHGPEAQSSDKSPFLSLAALHPMGSWVVILHLSTR